MKSSLSGWQLPIGHLAGPAQSVSATPLQSRVYKERVCRIPRLGTGVALDPSRITGLVYAFNGLFDSSKALQEVGIFRGRFPVNMGEVSYGTGCGRGCGVFQASAENQTAAGE